MSERSGLITFNGNPLVLMGPELSPGHEAPDFSVLASDLAEVKLSDFRGKLLLIASVPSLDTGVCDTETRRFNEEAARFDEDVRMLVISMDLPFAQKRWCTTAGIENLQTLSDHRDASFGMSYGVLVKELRLLARSVWVVDPSGTIRYFELVKELTDHPNYEACIDALRKVTDE